MNFGSLVRNARFADLKCESLRTSRAKCSFRRLDVRPFWRLDACLLEEARVPRKRAHKIFPRETGSTPQECHTRVCGKSVSQECRP